MNWVIGLMLYSVIWWIALFLVLPFYSRPVSTPDPRTGWRGAPDRVRFGRIVLVNSLLSLVIWGGCYMLITSDWLSFRHGFLAMDPGRTPERRRPGVRTASAMAGSRSGPLCNMHAGCKRVAVANS